MVNGRQQTLLLGVEQWKIIKHFHDSSHFGGDSLDRLIFQLSLGKSLFQTVRRVTACELCACNNPGDHPTPPPFRQPIQHRGTYPGEDWQMDFTQMLPCKGLKYLPVFMDTFTGGVEAFPIRTEKALEVSKCLLKEITPQFGLPKSLQSDNRPSFTDKMTQQVSSTLGVIYHPHSSWRPQSVLSKNGKANHVLKRTLAKLCQENSENWVSLLPVAPL